MELNDIGEAYENAFYRKRKDDITDLFVLAEAIYTRIVYFFSSKEDRKEDDVLWAWDVYPNLFPEEQKMAEERKSEREMEKIKADRRKRKMRIEEERRAE